MQQSNQNIKNLLKQTHDWPEIKKAIDKISQKGFEVLIVGGAVRDALLNKIPKDMDLATSAKPEELLKIFPSAKGHWIKYAVVFLPLKTKNNLEIATFRKESAYKDGRRPESVSFSNKENDAQRRDFTVNALFYDPQTEQILDFVGGLKDLQNKTLRTVGKAKERFEEDHLRPFRALRLAHQLQFQIEDQTKKAISGFAVKIKQIAKERILDELTKMLSVGQIGKALKSLKEYQVFYSVFPDLKNAPKNKYLNKPSDFWDQSFSFCSEPAFFWTALGLPYFYSDNKSFENFLKTHLVPSAHKKQSLSYFRAVHTLTSSSSSFTDKLLSLNRQKHVVAKLAGFWLDSLRKNRKALNFILQEFEKREKKGCLPKALVTGADILQLSPTPPKPKFSLLLKKAYEYQMEQAQASSQDILNHIMKIK